MELIMNFENKSHFIKFEYNTIFFGKNSTYKSGFLTSLVNGLMGKNKNLLINGAVPNFKEYDVILIDEESDFANEFKFTKNNTLKKLIYDDVVDKINEEKLINYTNEIFDVIDHKVNKLLDRKINRKNDNNISFQIEISDINAIIDKFTNIYIDNILLSDNDISKAMKRKLLYQLYFLDIQNQSEKKYFIVINNFDAYLNINEIVTFLNTINHLSNENCHFILTSCNNIFEYLALDYFSVYKITNRVLSIELLNEAVKKYLLRREYKLLQNNDINEFEQFYIENEYLLSNDEILEVYNKLLNIYPHLLSKIFNSNSIKVVLTKPKNITSEYIICESRELQQLFLEICNLFID